MIPKLDVLFEPSDVWVGTFFEWPKVYICFVPMVAIRLTWRTKVST
jgi:hypothetical protein